MLVSLYDDATEIKRTDPNIVLVEFLGAYLTDRDDQEAELYSCKAGVEFSQLREFRDEVKRVEVNYSVGIVVAWKNLSIQVLGNRATARVDIVRTISGGGEETFDPWKFEMSDEDGWRVCSADPA
ncbi:hypothetical protein Asi03nite_52970 [Actinoplanes siamensis]|uniref:Uncharacterized protein n=1 Tax=Actinoplanes siamensis TaxID=1223317 RepID=A0A919NAV9_9ACTN|nr:hypothetical protein Asi03nite_52970 [Actinoplanes siamensis]